MDKMTRNNVVLNVISGIKRNYISLCSGVRYDMLRISK